MNNFIAERPEVSLENFEAVYDYYERDPSRVIATLGHLAVSTKYKPDVIFDSEAEEQIGEVFDGGGQAFLLANHVYGEDVRHLPSLLWRERVFKPMITRTNIYGKSELVSGRSQGAKVQRILYDELGMVPVFRRKDLAEDEWSEDNQILFPRAKERLLDLGASKLNRGFHAAIFPEGERDEVLAQEERDPSKVRRLMGGFAEMIGRSERLGNIFIVIAGLSYPDLPFKNPTSKQEKSTNKEVKLRPTLFIPRPVEVTRENIDNLVSIAQDSLQSAVTEASQRRSLSGRNH